MVFCLILCTDIWLNPHFYNILLNMAQPEQYYSQISVLFLMVVVVVVGAGCVYEHMHMQVSLPMYMCGGQRSTLSSTITFMVVSLAFNG